LKQPLQQARSDAENMEKSVFTLDKDTMALQNAKGFLKDTKQKIRTLETNKKELDKQYAETMKQK